MVIDRGLWNVMYELLINIRMIGFCVLDMLMEFNLIYRWEIFSDMGNELIFFFLNGGNYGFMLDL